MRRTLSTLLVAALALPLAGCPGNFQQQKTQTDIDSMRKEIADLKAAQAKAQGDASSRQRLAELGTQLDQLRTDLSFVQGQMEKYGNDLSKKGDDQLKVRQDLEIRIAQLDDQIRTLQTKLANMPTSASAGVGATASNTPVPTTTSLAIATASPAATAMAIMTPANPPTPHATTPGLQIRVGEPAIEKETDQTVYKKGVELFDAKKFADSRTTFTEVITKFPKSDFADNARYWIGESYYAEKDFASAALEFEKVVKDYPNGDKVPAALLKEGYAFLELGEKDGGTETLRELIKKFPKSEEAKKAKEKLAKVK